MRLPGDFLQAAGQQLEAQEGPAPLDEGDAPSRLQSAATVVLVQQWQQMSQHVLCAVVQHSSPLLRAAAQAVIAALSPAAYAAVPEHLQQLLLGWCCAAAAADEASPVRAAAAKALGAVAICPALCAVPNGEHAAAHRTKPPRRITPLHTSPTWISVHAAGPAQALAALEAACHDGVLAVRIPATASLASFCHMLSHTTAMEAGSAIAAGHHVLLGCLRLAVASAADSDKLRPSGLQALGSLSCQLATLSPELQQTTEEGGDEQRLLAAGVQAVHQALAASNARVQWAACEAAGQLLACQAASVQRHLDTMVQQLLLLLQECPNFRSRALAAAALQQLSSTAVRLHGGERLVQVLDVAAAVLFQGGAHQLQPVAGCRRSATQRSFASKFPAVCGGGARGGAS